MKKILATVSALACAATCAFGLAACGGGDTPNPNLLTEAEWKDSFKTAMEAPDYSFQQSTFDATKNDYVLDTELMVNGASRSYYSLYYWNNASNVSTLFKKDGIYYDYFHFVDGANIVSRTQTCTAAEFEKKEEEDYLPWNAIINQALTFCRDSFSDFTTVGGMTYKAENLTGTFTNPSDDSDQPFTVEKATIMFQDKKLVNVEVSGIDMGEDDKVYWQYFVGVDVFLQAKIADVTLPKIKGANYELTAVGGMASASDVTANEGKYIKWKDDGTLEGDISINGLNIADGTMTCGNDGIVVKIGDYTLTGYYMLQNGDTTLELTLALDENTEAKYTFTQVLNTAA